MFEGAFGPLFTSAGERHGSDLGRKYPVKTVVGNPLTISDPSAISKFGTTIEPGDPVIMVAGTQVRFASSDYLVIDDSLSDPDSPFLTIGGHAVTANPTSFDITRPPVLAGEPEVTVHGTPISLRKAGHLVFGADVPRSGSLIDAVITLLPLS